jgi:isopentenyl-diphosphate delta-isomerase
MEYRGLSRIVATADLDERVVLVDDDDTPRGTAPKLDAHQDGGVLHRAFSIFVLNSKGELLLQRRAATKYHFGGLWSNTVCGHPREHESLHDAVHRRLVEEFGFTTPLSKSFSFTYRATDPLTGLTEHEYDHVFTGIYDGNVAPNPAEIEEWRWANVAELTDDVLARPHLYTPWFQICYSRFLEAVSQS